MIKAIKYSAQRGKKSAKAALVNAHTYNGEDGKIDQVLTQSASSVGTKTPFAGLDTAKTLSIFMSAVISCIEEKNDIIIVIKGFNQFVEIRCNDLKKKKVSNNQCEKK